MTRQQLFPPNKLLHICASSFVIFTILYYFQYPNFDRPKSGISFGSAYFCKGILPRDIVTEPIKKTKRSLLTKEEAERFKVILGGDATLDMFEDYEED